MTLFTTIVPLTDLLAPVGVYEGVKVTGGVEVSDVQCEDGDLDGEHELHAEHAVGDQRYGDATVGSFVYLWMRRGRGWGEGVCGGVRGYV